MSHRGGWDSWKATHFRHWYSSVRFDTQGRRGDPCHIEVVGIAGKLPIFGIGTAVFALTLRGGVEILLRIHNCLYSFGEFNLLSVSQICTGLRTAVDLSLSAPNIRLYSSDDRVGNNRKQFVDIPLVLDEGLYALRVEPVSSDDQRHLTSQIFDVTPPGEYVLACTTFDAQTKGTRQMWTTMVLSVNPSGGRIFTFAGPVDFQAELTSFSDHFLAPAALPPTR